MEINATAKLIYDVNFFNDRFLKANIKFKEPGKFFKRNIIHLLVLEDSYDSQDEFFTAVEGLLSDMYLLKENVKDAVQNYFDEKLECGKAESRDERIEAKIRDINKFNVNVKIK